MSALLEKAASPAVINDAWRKHRRDKAIWRIGVSREEMKPHMVYHLTCLCEELRSGNYRPDPVRFFPVNKGDGKDRIISAVTLRDKVAQRAVLAVLDPMGEAIFHENSFGYRPGRSIDMALAKCREHINCGMEWVVDADIRSYFDEIPLISSSLPEPKPMPRMPKDLWRRFSSGWSLRFTRKRPGSRNAAPKYPFWAESCPKSGSVPEREVENERKADHHRV